MAKNPWALPDGFDEVTKKALSVVFAALRNSRKHITPQALEALRLGNLAAFMQLVDWTGVTDEFSKLESILSDQAKRTALDIYKTGGVGSQLTFDLINEKAVEYAMQRAGELVVSITKEMRETINDIITRSTQGEFTVQQAGKLIRTNLPLTPRDANAVLSYADRQYLRFLRDGYSDLKARIKADAMGEKYADKLTRKRALVIARTETAKASMEGALAGWRSGVETGLIDNTSQKEWIAEADACDICGPMDGVLVRWDAPFSSGVMTPPQHPNCRCSMAILPPDYTDTPFTGQVYQNNSNKVKVEFEYGNQLIKHLSGQHDQASHGRGGGSVAVDVGQVTRKTATPAQVEALGEYFADGYESINGFARGKTTVAEAEYNGVERVQEKIAIIDNVIATTAPTIEEMTVYRGVSVKVAAGLAKSPVGTVIVNKGFVSTSQNKKVADSFAKGAVLNIRVPKGVKAFDVSKYVNKKEYENEMIFARDTKMVITNTSDNTIFVDLLP